MSALGLYFLINGIGGFLGLIIGICIELYIAIRNSWRKEKERRKDAARSRRYNEQVERRWTERKQEFEHYKAFYRKLYPDASDAMIEYQARSTTGFWY